MQFSLLTYRLKARSQLTVHRYNTATWTKQNNTDTTQLHEPNKITQIQHSYTNQTKYTDTTQLHEPNKIHRYNTVTRTKQNTQIQHSYTNQTKYTDTTQLHEPNKTHRYNTVTRTKQNTQIQHSYTNQTKYNNKHSPTRCVDQVTHPY